ncbi:SDR family oxidoreductase [Caldibacillus thermolactis]|jgi:NAD(P)-dependent dehydrogenase (short-subunit alcohol dehydrogenase family)|uniref:SDR family oxidoreductase n=1 Tax=Pallidibacillus thermolactis TaxID=251051 RepID=A0ABT2WFB9_9BACI|nr:SDR family oxidoreductase [Pallidibacillus thermolactis]MCU9594370.1 SDR family oxidoreductase [Pallidibacillus thermolactis]MCU9602033.1 SDR family oxidoreductase [Pallidibacillus thermolactis subsp. kokeshiiformis]MED1673017.1 SDR family oxidoreductase [Pallidibacillus thermolactis subsp. kokeshiiformis]
MHVTDLFSLKGKTAIVTGGGRGLGEQIATAFAEAGANVVVCSRKVENCIEVSEKLKQLGVESFALKCDITNPEEVKHVVDSTVEKFGRIDILVNNSGATWGAPVEEMPLEAFQKVLNVNLVGTFLMSQTVGKIMIEQKAGKIINIASVAGLRGSNPDVMNTIGYNTSKAGVINFTRDLAAKWGQHNIHVNAIAPGFFPTKMSNVILERYGDKILEGTPLGRYGTDKDIKGVALFLAAPASDFVTGETIVVDGGAITW